MNNSIKAITAATILAIIQCMPMRAEFGMDSLVRNTAAVILWTGVTIYAARYLLSEVDPKKAKRPVDAKTVISSAHQSLS